MTPIFEATLKNLTLGFSPKFFLGVPIYVVKSGKNFGTKSQCQIFHGRPIHAVLQSLTPFSDLVDLADMAYFGAEKHVFRWSFQLGK